ncbi:hypothetical protein R3I93_012224 [Phoxinus phoxinus]|uniref:Uncharacterized protein n=2 Tax=Phoxinus phoxinus TaxID=58324 RepID=A0AAN9H4Z7_9TELE
MGRCGNVAFCAMVLFYSSLITGDHHCVSSAGNVSSSSPRTSVTSRDGVPDVNMSSSPQPETPSGNETQSWTNQSSSTEPTPHTGSTAGTVANSTAPAENVTFSGNITDSRNGSDVSPVDNQTAVITAGPTTSTTPLPSTTHEPTSTVHIITTFHTTPPETSRAPEVTSAHPKSSPTAASSAFPTVNTQMSASSSPVQAKAHADTPSALNVGDDDNNKVSTDPLLAGLVSAFVVVAAIVSVLIFLKFRNTNDGPQFRRLQDLPMDDMLEDAPLSMYSY